jgi:predicted nucleic acid-binding protein
LNAVVDSNFVIALVFEDDINHGQALERWKAVQTAYLPVIAASEIAYFLMKNHQSLDSLDEILADERIEIEESNYADLTYALSRRAQIRRYDDFNDMLILAASRRLSLELLSFDDELNSLSETETQPQHAKKDPK